jgi:uroporphyrinogen III methyltransferase/synthase
MEDHIRPALVYLVGAGPGDPGLLTLRGKECLERADVVIYDQLVSPRILQFCRPETEFVCVRELPGCHPDRWPHIHQRMIDEAQKGKCVVRLKGGDPLIFGRGGEEGESLRSVGIPYEVVPGITTALAAGSYLEIPLTHRSHSSAIAFVTGHEHPGKPTTSLNWANLAKFPGTLAIYMGMARLTAIVAELIRHGKSPETPALVVSKVSTGEQRSVRTTLERLENEIRHSGLVTPALILVGTAVMLKPERSWFEMKPLLNHHILVTRPRHQALEMMRQIELLGGVPFYLPCIEMSDPTDWGPLDRLISRLAESRFEFNCEGIDWLVFTSANGVEAFFKRLEHHGHDIRILARTRIACIGSNTAGALSKYALKADLAPEKGMNSEALADELLTLAKGKTVALAVAEEARELLLERLRSVTASVEKIPVYRQVERVDPSHEVFDHLRRGEIDLVTLTSPNIARTFLSACDETIVERIRSGQIRLVSNSSRLTEFLNERQLPVALESEQPTTSSMIQEMLKRPHQETLVT